MNQHLLAIAMITTIDTPVVFVPPGNGYPASFRLASFERTTDLVFDAAARHRVDPIKGVSECLGYAAWWVRY